MTIRSAAGFAVLVGRAEAHASDGWYSQLYLLPTARVAALELTGTLELYLPLESSGAPQLYATPGWAHWVFSPRVAAGATYLLAAQDGAPTGLAAGPSVRIAIPRGTVTVDGIRRIARLPNEIRITVPTGF